MIKKTIKHLRKKPEATRRMIALSTSLGVTAIIFILWGISFVPYASETMNKASVLDAFNAVNKSKQDDVDSDLNNTQAINNNESESINQGLYAEPLEDTSTSDGVLPFVDSTPNISNSNADNAAKTASSSTQTTNNTNSSSSQATTSGRLLIQ